MSNKQTDEQGKPLTYWGGLDNDHIVDANKKVSSIEWLIEHFGGIENCTPDFRYKIEQAKEMHKKEIVDAYRFGLSDEYVIGSEEYYNKTFGK